MAQNRYARNLYARPFLQYGQHRKQCGLRTMAYISRQPSNAPASPDSCMHADTCPLVDWTDKSWFYELLGRLTYRIQARVHCAFLFERLMLSPTGHETHSYENLPLMGV
jgi:hypothetical protein